jgi:hypothetical protein
MIRSLERHHILELLVGNVGVAPRKVPDRWRIWGFYNFPTKVLLDDLFNQIVLSLRKVNDYVRILLEISADSSQII